MINEDLTAIEKSLEKSLEIVDRGISEPAVFDDVVQFIDELDRLAAEIETYGIEGVLDEFDPVEMLLESGSSSGSGQRSFDSEEEAERVRKDLVRDKRLYKVAKSEFDVAVDDLETLKSMIDGATAEEAFRKFDADMDGSIQLSELDEVFDSALQSRLDINEDKVASIEELIEVVESIAREIREPMLFATQSLEVVQAGLRTELIGVNEFTLPGVDGTPTIQEAVRVGLENRLDLMNSRAEVTDARRALEISANALESTLNLEVRGEMPTRVSRTPFNFDPDAAQLDIGLQLTTPLDQIDERNDYAEALVTYQRARRTYMQAEDNVKTEIRNSWRQLTVAKQRLEIDRRQIRQAALQYDSSAQEASRGGQTNAFNLLQSLSSLLEAQNSLISDWIQYESNRLNIYRDMGIMEIDSRGVWIDDFYQRGQNTPADPGFNDLDASSSVETDPSELPLNLDEESTNEPIFPLDAVPNEPPAAPVIPAAPPATRGVRSLDRARFGRAGNRRRARNSLVASQSNGDVQLGR